MSVWKGARELSAGIVEVDLGRARPRGRRWGPVVFDPVRVVDGITLSDDPILLLPAARLLGVGRPAARSRAVGIKPLREDPRHRHRRPRARPGPRPCPRPRRDRGARRPRQPRHGRGRHAARRRPDVRRRRWPTWPSGSASTWSSSGPEAPLVAGVADAVRAPGHRLLRAVRRGRAARGLQGVRQGRDGRGRRAHRRGPGLRHPRRGRGRPRRVRRAVRREGRRPGRRQGRRGHRGPAGRARPRGRRASGW